MTLCLPSEPVYQVFTAGSLLVPTDTAFFIVLIARRWLLLGEVIRVGDVGLGGAFCVVCYLIVTGFLMVCL